MCYLCKFFMNVKQFQNKKFIWGEKVNSWAGRLWVVPSLSLGGLIHKMDNNPTEGCDENAMIDIKYLAGHIFSHFDSVPWLICLPFQSHVTVNLPSSMPLIKMLTKKRRGSCRRCWTQRQHPHWTWIVFQLAVNGLTPTLHLRLKSRRLRTQHSLHVH